MIPQNNNKIIQTDQSDFADPDLLHPRAQELYHAMRRYQGMNYNQAAPFRTLMAVTSIKHLATVTYHMNKLINAGLVVKLNRGGNNIYVAIPPGNIADSK